MVTSVTRFPPLDTPGDYRVPRRRFPHGAPNRPISTRSCGRSSPSRDANWKKLQQYVLDERETDRAARPGAHPLWGERREYTWYIRDGFFVRSPLKFNGVTIADAERRKFEADYLRRMQERDKRRARRQAEAGADDAAAAGARPGRRGRTRPARHRRPDQADARAGVHLVGVLPALQVRGRASTRSSAAKRSTAATCCASSTTRRGCSAAPTAAANRPRAVRRPTRRATRSSSG